VPRTQREAAERFINSKLEPLLKSLPGVSVRHAVLRFATDADSVGRVVCTNAEELGAAMVVIPSHGKGAQRCRNEARWSALAIPLAVLLRNSATLFVVTGRLREMFLGSTSNYCTHHCKAPVVVLR
jgi:nucleotide-binding universal stress UspA family protein